MDSTGGGARILLVDDEPDQVEMYRFGLEHSGFSVDEAQTGAAAIARASEVRPDVIVLDIRLPDMTGWDVCTALKSDPRTAQIPIIILTAAASNAVGEQAAHHGCAAHLFKPCYPEDLMRIIRAVLATA
jgi:two-component system cell cycle response regulator DivK